jgi:ATP/maltotriose-dependent transcriptional regulator MalT/DNA-binding SARP family transcriptional activator
MTMRLSANDEQIPQLASVILRPQLLNKLQLSKQHKVTLLCAPPGYGKTTIVSQFVRSLPYPVAWHTVEERERDAPNLHVRSIEALSSVVPGIQALDTTSTYLPGELATIITNYLRKTVDNDIFYVLDDLHLLSGATAAEAWLRTLVSTLPPKCHLILVSRTLPELPLTEMIARREVLAIGQDALRFSADEVNAMAQQVFGVNLPEPDVSRLVERLEGWPAGVVLALQPLPTELARSMLSGGDGPEALFEALATMMLDAQPPGLRDFLLASSTLARLTPELITGMLQLQNSEEWLAEAQNRNLFVSKVAGGLVYHRLFRDFLQRQLARQNPPLFISLHARAAHWFERKNQIDEAFDHYMTAKLADDANRMIDGVVHAYFIQGKVETLFQWNSSLKSASVFNPRLMYLCAGIQIDRYQYESAETELERVETIYNKQKDDAGLTNVRLHRARIDLQRGQFGRVVDQMNRLLALPLDQWNARGSVLRTLGYACLKLGLIDDAITHLEAAQPFYRANGEQLSLSNLLMDTEIAYRSAGRMEDAAACLQEVVAIRRSLGSLSALAFALNNLGFHYHQYGDYLQAHTTLQEGLSVLARVQDKRAESYLLWSLADLQRDRGGFDEAVQFYNRALQLIGTNNPSLRCNILINISILRRWQSNFYDAALLADEASILANAHNLAIEGLMAKAAMWAARAHLGEMISAGEHLNSLAAELVRLNARSEAAHVYALCANSAILRLDKPGAEQCLRQALNLVQNGASLQSIASDVMHGMLLESIIASNPARYATLLHLIDKLKKARLKPSNIVRLKDKVGMETVYSLRVQTLGKEIIERDGVLVLSTEWRAAAARELFFYLLFLGPHSREAISLDFWPDSSPSRVRSNFHTTLYRVRQALGENVIVYKDDTYCINPDVDIWCDAHEFEALVKQARPLPRRDARTEDLWRRAVALYQGECLPQLGTDWVEPYREQLSEMYLEAIIALGGCAQARRDFSEAVRMFKQALKIDVFREDVHQALLLCYAAKGDKRKIQQHFAELQRVLRQELEVEPSKETQALVKSLLK